MSASGRATLTEIDLDWTVTEHWLMHVPAPAGTTFVAVLFPRRHDEASPEVAYLAREETVVVRYAGQQDLIFLRPSPAVACGLDGVVFQGRAGVARSVAGQPYALYPLDAVRMESVEAANRRVRNLDR